MSGVSAWSDAVAAIALLAHDPAALGGIVLRARAGPVRDRWLALLRAALPAGIKLRRLPAQLGDDVLLGGLDLAATLQAGRPIARTGLLAEADGGVLVMPMAERIEPGVAARICAALDEGAITVARDGFVRHLPARFGLIALDEGSSDDEHPPASLCDRLAIQLDLDGVALRDCEEIAVPDESEDAIDPEEAIAALCAGALSLGILSLRPTILALRTARAAAALAGRDRLVRSDLALACRLVLAPRAITFPAEQPEQRPPEPEPPDPSADQTDQPDDGPGQPAGDIVLEAVRAVLPPELLASLARDDGGRGRSRSRGRAGDMRISTKRGRPIGASPGDPRDGARLHIVETLKAAAPWQALRGASPGRLQIRRDDFRVVRFRQRIGSTTVFAVDASGSAALNRLAEAKGAVELLLADCYVRRDQVALIAFRGTGANILLAPTTSLARAKRSLAGLPGGGATPLAAGIDAAAALADQVRRGGRTPLVTLLTDARANAPRSGQGGRGQAEADAIDSARQLRAAGIAALLVDTSPRPNPFARILAGEMSARYVPLPYADASSVTRAVRSAMET